MRKIEIVNFGTKEAAVKEYGDFMHQATIRNRCITVFLVAIVFAWGLAMFAIASFVPENWRATSGFAVSIIAGVLAYFLCESYESTCSYFWPTTYQYHKILDDYRILKVEVERCGDCDYRDVHFTVANKNNEVSDNWICGFRVVTKTDVQSTLIDIANRKICEPYIE